MRALALPCINQHTIFEVPRFSNSKDIIRQNFKNGSHDLDYVEER